MLALTYDLQYNFLYSILSDDRVINFIERGFTSLLLGTLIILCCSLDGNILFLPMILTIHVGAFLEICNILSASKLVEIQGNKSTSICSKIILLGQCFLVSCICLEFCASYHFVILLFLLIISVAMNPNNIDKTFLFTLIYPTIATIALVQLRIIDSRLPLTVIFLMWVNDTFAYCTGITIGKTKFSHISPNKTIEGLLGGMVATILFAEYYLQDDPLIQSKKSFGLVCAVSGILGDLFESFLKRMANLKDSGKLLPGHGGVLDRFDSLLFAAPAALLFLKYFSE